MDYKKVLVDKSAVSGLLESVLFPCHQGCLAIDT